MISGLPGKMARMVAEIIVANRRKGLELYSWGLTGPEIEDHVVDIGNQNVYLVKPSERDKKISDMITPDSKPFYAVDFTLPKAVNWNVEFYCRHSIPFVMGTTGGDRENIFKMIRESNICAVIAPNMAAQIVAFQAMMEYGAKTFPGVFEGFNLFISESHQKGKADTSGTAKAIAESFRGMGIPFHFENKNQFEMIRDPARQAIMGVPEQYIDGHGWHEYNLATEDGTMSFKFVHKVNGRRPYAMGLLKALPFLEKKIEAGEKGKVYSMVEALKG